MPVFLVAGRDDVGLDDRWAGATGLECRGLDARLGAPCDVTLVMVCCLGPSFSAFQCRDGSLPPCDACPSLLLPTPLWWLGMASAVTMVPAASTTSTACVPRDRTLASAASTHGLRVVVVGARGGSGGLKGCRDGCGRGGGKVHSRPSPLSSRPSPLSASGPSHCRRASDRMWPKLCDDRANLLSLDLRTCGGANTVGAWCEGLSVCITRHRLMLGWCWLRDPG